MLSANFIFITFNLIFLSSGCFLASTGFILFYDFDRILLSTILIKDTKLSDYNNPLFFYVAYGLIILGLTVSFISLIGCWISYTKNYFLIILYFLSILVLLIVECVFFLITWLWPHCLGLNLSVLRLSKSLQSNYGVPEQELFTAAVDMAQTYFHCCGILSWTEYENSLWKLKSYGNKYLSIPLSCCKLKNERYYRSYLNPEPENQTLCQNLEMNVSDLRYNEGCLESIERWYHEQYLIFVAISLTLILIEFSVLLSALLSCTKIDRQNYTMKTGTKSTTTSNPTVSYSSDYCSDSYILSNTFRRNYQIN